MPLCLSCDTSESNSVMGAGLNGGGFRAKGWMDGTQDLSQSSVTTNRREI